MNYSIVGDRCFPIGGLASISYRCYQKANGRRNRAIILWVRCRFYREFWF